MDWWGLLTLLISAAVALLCITLHELSHGFVAWRLGDPTAKNAGRLTLNPIKHLDLFGLLMMLVAKVGWAKPVPVDMRYFKHPKQGMALTALAGQGARCCVLVVIQMQGVRAFAPNWATQPEFGRALQQAAAAGVEIHAMDCAVAPASLTLRAPVPVLLDLPG